MMAVALVAMLLIGRLVLHIGGIVLLLLILLTFLAFLFYAGTRNLLHR